MLGSGRARENDSASIEAQMVNVFEAVLHQQECGRNLRRSRVLELLCPEASELQGPRAFRLPLSATATLPERSQTEWV